LNPIEQNKEKREKIKFWKEQRKIKRNKTNFFFFLKKQQKFWFPRQNPTSPLFSTESKHNPLLLHTLTLKKFGLSYLCYKNWDFYFLHFLGLMQKCILQQFFHLGLSNEIEKSNLFHLGIDG
jgi:hypothetical protein